MESNAGESAATQLEALANTLEQLRGHSHSVLQPLPFPTGEPGPDVRTVRAHLQQLHECTAALLASARAASQECEQLRRLPPPPPIGSDELAAQRAELEDLRAADEVHRRQIGALVFEKGRLNGALRRREEEMRSLGEEKAAVVAALSAALRRVTEERDLAVRAERQARRGAPAAGGAGTDGNRGKGSSSEMEISSEMLISQKRTIEGLRKARRNSLALEPSQLRTARRAAPNPRRGRPRAAALAHALALPPRPHQRPTPAPSARWRRSCSARSRASRAAARRLEGAARRPWTAAAAAATAARRRPPPPPPRRAP